MGEITVKVVLEEEITNEDLVKIYDIFCKNNNIPNGEWGKRYLRLAGKKLLKSEGGINIFDRDFIFYGRLLGEGEVMFRGRGRYIDGKKRDEIEERVHELFYPKKKKSWFKRLDLLRFLH